VLRALAVVLVVVSVTLLIAGCGGEPAGADGRVAVTATTTQVADFARNVGGSRVEVTGLLAPNADPHEYEPRPDDVKSLARAKLVLRSGGDLDEWLDGAIESAGGDARVVTLIDSVHRIGKGKDTDPHWWQDPRNAELAVGAISEALAKADPEGRAQYNANASAYLEKLRALDRAVVTCLNEVPATQRKLVTTHDALGYYARRYGIEVIGTVIPSLSTQGQPSAGETAKLIDTIRRARVKALFAESSVNAKVEQAIARETGAKVGKPLWADTLGSKASDGATYLQSIAANTKTLVAGFTGGARSCELPAT
jgi:ABC-type Zn uptake system ZnuABC Zn-binding protein ZnuA